MGTASLPQPASDQTSRQLHPGAGILRGGLWISGLQLDDGLSHLLAAMSCWRLWPRITSPAGMVLQPRLALQFGDRQPGSRSGRRCGRPLAGEPLGLGAIGLDERLDVRRMSLPCTRLFIISDAGEGRGLLTWVVTKLVAHAVGLLRRWMPG